MNKIDISQRLSARTHFKSLLLLTLLAGTASAQQMAMPPMALEMPAAEMPSAPALSLPTLDATVLPSLDDVSSLKVPPTLSGSCQPSSDESSRATWTMRQHATWLLGLKPRQVMRSAIEPALPKAPHVDIQPTLAAMAELPALPEVPAFSLQAPTSSAPVVPLDSLPASAVMLVQHNESTASTADANPMPMPAVVTANGQAVTDASQVVHSHQSSPPGLNLGPVIAGPVRALPIEQMATESLLQVDVSGIDSEKVSASEPASESWIDSFGFRPPTGFSMRDSEPATLVASPGHAGPVSIHEGFAPRISVANQAAQLGNTMNSSNASKAATATETSTSTSDRLTIRLPGPNQFSMSDAAQSASGPVLNHLSDAGPVHETLGDDPEPTEQQVAVKPTKGSQPVEKSFSDKGNLLASAPVEVSSDRTRTSRSGKPEVLTPPSRLTKDSPAVLPLSSAVSIASTGIDAQLPSCPSADGSVELTVKPAQAVIEPSVAKVAPATDKAPESLIDQPVPPPSLSAENKAPAKIVPTKIVKAPPALVAAPAAPIASLTSSQATPPSAAAPVVKPPAPKHPQKFTLNNSNPIALKRPVMKAANVAIPETAGSESSVVQSSHETDEGSQQMSEYATMAAKMQQAIKHKFPNSRVKITCNEDGLIAEGHVVDSAEATKVLTYVRKTSLCPVVDRVTTSK